MTTEEIQRFYEKDKKKYIIMENDEFLVWYRLQTNAGFVSQLDLDEIQELINKISAWYLIKTDDNKDNFNNDLPSVSKITKLFNILKDKEKQTLDCINENDNLINKRASIILREKILKIASLSILYSQDETPQTALIKAKSMIEEFNKPYNLNINTEYLDNKIKNAMTKEEQEKPFLGKAIIYKQNNKKRK